MMRTAEKVRTLGLHLDPGDELLSVPEAAQFLKVKKNFVYEKMTSSPGEKPEIFSFRCGKYRRILRSELLKYLARQNPDFTLQ